MNKRDTRRGGNAAPPGALSSSETELAAQRAAISEVLLAIASSPDDLQPIFDAIVDNATRLCRADAGIVRLVEEAGLSFVARRQRPAHAHIAPKVIGPGSFYDPLIASKSPFHIPDLTAHELYRARPI